jgi:hypothetical protein
MLTTLSTLAQATDDLTLRLARLLIGCSGGRGLLVFLSRRKS